MKKIYLTLLAIAAFASINAASYTVTISGFAYTPSVTVVNIGDVVTINASGNHPLSQVNQATWTANGTTTLSSGWGTKTTNHTFTITAVGDIYFVCSAHAGMGMKGMISVANPNGLTQNSLNIQNLSVFPNPANEKLIVSLNSPQVTNASFKLYSVTGQEVAVLSANLALNTGANTVELLLPAGLSNGNYILQVISDSKTDTKKVIVLK